MIASSPSAKALSLILSVSVLIGGLLLAAPHRSLELAGGGEAAEARVGATFEDMAAGTLTAEPVEDSALTPTPPEPPDPVTAKEATQPSDIHDAIVPQAATAILPTARAMAPTPAVAVLPAVVPENTTEAIAGQELAPTAPPQSMRPRKREPEKAAEIAAERPKTPQVAGAKPAPRQDTKAQRGNATRNTTQGAATATNQQATAKTQGAARKAAAQSGNAATSNYPGQVMRRIARVPKPRVNARGTAVIAFVVSGDGGLERVSVAQSSGSAALDKAAVDVIRKAAPFPVPPRRAQRQFSIRIKGR